MDFFEVLIYIIVFMGAVTFIFSLFEASGLRDWAKKVFGVKHPQKQLFHLVNCDFCIGFWISVIVFLIMWWMEVQVFSDDYYLFLYPFAAYGWYIRFNYE